MTERTSLAVVCVLSLSAATWMDCAWAGPAGGQTTVPSRGPRSCGAGSIYISLTSSLRSLSGDSYSGEVYYVVPEGLFAVPELDPGLSLGAAIGWRRQDYALELGMSQSSHDGSWLGESLDADQRTVGFTVKWYVWQTERIRPYAAGRLGLVWLIIEQGYRTDDALATGTFWGPQAGFGIGADLSVLPYTCLSAQVLASYGFYTEVSGDVHTRPTFNIDGSEFPEYGVEATLGISVCFSL
jgi:hypothetical protein